VYYNIRIITGGACHSTAPASVTADFFARHVQPLHRSGKGVRRAYIYNNTLVNDARDPAGLSFDYIVLEIFSFYDSPAAVYIIYIYNVSVLCYSYNARI